MTRNLIIPESRIVITALLIAFVPVVAFSQQTTGTDSLRTMHADSSAVQDSLQVRFIPAIGSLRQTIDSSSQFHSSQLLWTDARYYGNLLWEFPGFFQRDLGEPAKPGQFNAWGTDWRGVAILMDGRPMNDPITGTYNLYDMPMEFIQQVEDFPGVSSTAESWDAPGSAVNFVTRQYNTLRPITKIRYIQAPYNSLLTDGLFTQNLVRGLNFMFGFQRRVSDGRFNGARATTEAPPTQGAIVNNWNVRTRLRYNFSDRFNIALTDFYTKDINGLNGGVDTSRSVNMYDDIAAFVNSPNAVETVARRDASLIAVARLFDDSSSITQANIYYTHLLRDYVNPGSEFNLLDIKDSHYAELSGIRIQQSFHSGFQNTEVGIQAERSQYLTSGFYDSTAQAGSANRGKKTISSGFLRSSLRPIEMTTFSISARYDEQSGQSAPSFGAGVTVNPHPFIGIFGEFGQTYRFPTFQETSWADSTILRPLAISKEKHTLVRAGVEFHLGKDNLLSFTGFDRTVDNAIVFRAAETSQGSPAVQILNINQTHTRGLVGSLNAQAGPFALLATLLYTRYTERDTTQLLTPEIIASGELSYRHKFFNDHLDAKLATRVHFMSHERGMTINPRLMLYSENSSGDIPAWTRLDLYAVLKIGDAYITLAYENLLNLNYYVTPIYPMPARTFRFGVNWAFLD